MNEDFDQQILKEQINTIEGYGFKKRLFKVYEQYRKLKSGQTKKKRRYIVHKKKKHTISDNVYPALTIQRLKQQQQYMKQSPQFQAVKQAMDQKLLEQQKSKIIEHEETIKQMITDQKIKDQNTKKKKQDVYHVINQGTKNKFIQDSVNVQVEDYHDAFQNHWRNPSDQILQKIFNSQHIKSYIDFSQGGKNMKNIIQQSVNVNPHDILHLSQPQIYNNLQQHQKQTVHEAQKLILNHFLDYNLNEVNRTIQNIPNQVNDFYNKHGKNFDPISLNYFSKKQVHDTISENWGHRALYEHYLSVPRHIPHLDQNHSYFRKMRTFMMGLKDETSFEKFPEKFQLFDEDQDGSGYKQKRGMYNFEIDEMMKSQEWFKGTHSFNDWENVIIDKNNNFGFIVNTAVINDQDVDDIHHWCSVYVDHDNKQILFYDSLNDTEVDQKFIPMLQHLQNEVSNELYYKIKINKSGFQEDNTSNCGQYAMTQLLLYHQTRDFKTSYDFHLKE